MTLSCFRIYWSKSDLWSDQIPAESRFVDSAYESGPFLSLTSACFFCLVKVTSCWPATQWNLSALLVAGTSCSVVSTALVHTLCLVYSGGTVGAPPPFLSLVPSVFCTLFLSSVFPFFFLSAFLTIPTQNSSYTVDPDSICVSAGSSLYWERPRRAPTEHLPADKQSRNPLLDCVFTMRFTQNWESV